MSAPARPVSWLYVPGDQPARFAKAVASGAHVVIVDLEDAVAPEHKERARREALAFAADAAPGTVEVRVNPVRSGPGRADLEAVGATAGLRAVRLPKIETADDVRTALGLLEGGVPVCCLLETALGVENAFAIASASPRVAALGLGEADLAGDLGTSADAGLAYPRSRVVVAARAAGLPAPAQSVYADVRDLDGLRASSAAGRALGFVGRAAVHPRQVPVIHDAYRPSAAEVAAARSVLDGLASARENGHGVVALPDGRMVDAAMRRRAEDVLILAEALSG